MTLIYKTLVRIFFIDFDFFDERLFPFLKGFLNPYNWVYCLFFIWGLLSPLFLSKANIELTEKFVISTVNYFIYNKKDLANLKLDEDLLKLLSQETFNKISGVSINSIEEFFSSLDKQLVLKQGEHFFKMFLLEHYPDQFFEIYPKYPVLEPVIKEFLGREFPELYKRLEEEERELKEKELLTKDEDFFFTIFTEEKIEAAFEELILEILEDLDFDNNFYNKYIRGYEFLITLIVVNIIKATFF